MSEPTPVHIVDAARVDGEAAKLALENADLRQQMADLKQQIAENTYCAYCGLKYPRGTRKFRNQALTDHIRVCPQHPMRKVEQQLLAAQAREQELLPYADHRDDCSFFAARLASYQEPCECGFSEIDSHPDHAALDAALAEARQAGLEAAERAVARIGLSYSLRTDEYDIETLKAIVQGITNAADAIRGLPVEEPDDRT